MLVPVITKKAALPSTTQSLMFQDRQTEPSSGGKTSEQGLQVEGEAGEGPREVSRVKGVFCTLMGVWFTQVDEFGKT